VVVSHNDLWHDKSNRVDLLLTELAFQIARHQKAMIAQKPRSILEHL
jgi:hypothetical protein